MKTFLAASFAAAYTNALSVSVQQTLHPGGWEYFDPPASATDNPCASLVGAAGWYHYEYNWDLCTCTTVWDNDFIYC